MKIHLDTYHMNIEERDMYQAVRLAGDHLAHLHLSESHRGVPGTGLVHWDDLFRGLQAIHYQGFAALESFVDLTSNMNTWVWRRMAPDGDTLIREGVAFIRGMMREYRLA